MAAQVPRRPMDGSDDDPRRGKGVKDMLSDTHVHKRSFVLRSPSAFRKPRRGRRRASTSTVTSIMVFQS